ncbi:hypothetical protein GIW05_00585 [Pseudomonas syringae]|uniref:hypothetical protein n=1 Tax=Pseudomonas syringae TaxID=317 RepID=UPI001F48D770|nr:hypothetical protein [Pseudomonas syringae]MCF5382017.1 hypothetical protein [Pseudomonas syringae]MCF5419450.1 hypothetical protein [Pseudomonas syringae]MCF5451996.1 hypothetical protein [Pseudomonas syringae]MCF5456283.1 hypothetical protein [Pseudomonas syringae]
MEEVQTYPPEPFDHKRQAFEAGIKEVEVERFDYRNGDAVLKFITERNRTGRYAVDWVRGAWAGYNMPRPAAGTNEEAAERAEFESVIGTLDLTRLPSGEYQNGYVQSTWEGWQARAKLNVVVPLVLPERRPDPSCMTALDDDRENALWNSFREEFARLNAVQL